MRGAVRRWDACISTLISASKDLYAKKNGIFAIFFLRNIKMENKGRLSWGYIAGIISGITYGMNPLFGVPVINKGLDVNSLLFYRYGMATLLMLVFMVVAKSKSASVGSNFG